MPNSSVFELLITGADEARRYVAYVPDGRGGRAAEQTFEWSVDSTALALELGQLARNVTQGAPPADDLHVRFGQRLYQTVFSGTVGELWRQRRQAARREPLRLALRLDPAKAGPLRNLPWEYLHDGEGFLALDLRTPLTRLA